MLEILLGASGGIFGILGGLAKHGIEVWQKGKEEQATLALTKEKNAHELLMADKIMEQMKMEAEKGISQASIAASAEIDKAAFSAIAASYDNDKASYTQVDKGLLVVDLVRGLTRPILTALFSLFLIVATVYLMFKVGDAVFSTDKFMTNTLYRLIDACIFLATSAVGWWFAARGSSSKEGK